MPLQLTSADTIHVIDTFNTQMRSARPNTQSNEASYGSILNLDIIKQEQHIDRDLICIIKYLNENTLPNDDKLARKIILQSVSYAYIGNILYHCNCNKRKTNDNMHLQLVIPQNLREPVIKAAHDDLMHRGIPATYNTLVHNYFWINMLNDITNYVRSCETCCQYNKLKKDSRAPLQAIQPIFSPFSSYAIDIFGALPITQDGYQYVLLVIDTFTKYCELIPLKSIDAYTVAVALFENIICRYGSFDTILSDRGSQFISMVHSHLIKMIGAKHLSSTSYRHETVGAAERNIQTIKNMLSKMVNGEVNRWIEYLPLARFSYNITVNETTATSPFMLTHARWPKLCLDSALIKPLNVTRSVEQELNDITQKAIDLQNMATESIKKAQEKMTKQYDKHSTPVIYTVGMYVWLYVYKLINKYSSKFSQKYVGPFVIIKREGLNCWLQNPSDGKDVKLPVHVNRLAPYTMRTIKPPIPIIVPQHDELDYESQLTHEVENLLGMEDGHSTEGSNNDMITGNALKAAETGVNILPRPTNAELIEQPTVMSVPVARIQDGVTMYHIIYNNNQRGRYVKESELTLAEKQFIEANYSNIKILRHKPKLPRDICMLCNVEVDSLSNIGLCAMCMTYSN